MPQVTRLSLAASTGLWDSFKAWGSRARGALEPSITELKQLREPARPGRWAGWLFSPLLSSQLRRLVIYTLKAAYSHQRLPCPHICICSLSSDLSELKALSPIKRIPGPRSPEGEGRGLRAPESLPSHRAGPGTRSTAFSGWGRPGQEGLGWGAKSKDRLGAPASCFNPTAFPAHPGLPDSVACSRASGLSAG